MKYEIIDPDTDKVICTANNHDGIKKAMLHAVWPKANIKDLGKIGKLNHRELAELFNLEYQESDYHRF